MNPSKKRERLVDLIQRMNDGNDISSRDMKIVLSDIEHDEFIQMWNAEKEKRTADKPKVVKEYEILLKKWHIAEARIQRYRTRINFKQNILFKMSYQIDTFLENIQTYLIEHQGDSEFRSWLDRDIKTDNAHSTYNPDSPSNSLHTPPLVITSRSNLKQNNGFMEKMSKRDIKLIILEQSLMNLDMPKDNFNLENLRQDINKINNSKLKKFTGFKT